MNFHIYLFFVSISKLRFYFNRQRNGLDGRTSHDTAVREEGSELYGGLTGAGTFVLNPGTGNTLTLTMGNGTVFKPNGTNYLTITESLSGTMLIDASGLNLESSYDRIPLFKVGSAEMLSSVSVDFAAGAKPKGCKYPGECPHNAEKSYLINL